MSKYGKAHLYEIYKRPLPLQNVIPLPPLSFNPLHMAYFLYRYLFPSSPPSQTRRLAGTLNEETRSVWVTDTEAATSLWVSGFFGKGQFSRSEPSWYIRTQRSLGLIGKDEKLTSEEITARRRVARAEMKAERALKEKQDLEATLRAEGRLQPAIILPPEDSVETVETALLDNDDHGGDDHDQDEDDDVVESIPNLEHLQLTLHEALFLSLALDALDIYSPDPDRRIIPKSNLLSRFTHLSSTMSADDDDDDDDDGTTTKDHSFLIQYAVYHHYRSLGWTVKPALKFGVDWLLYKRGPVFNHAEFSVVVLPVPRNVVAPKEKPWWWLHTLSRVNGQVKKTIILTYVEYDPGQIDLQTDDLPTLLRKFKIREVSIKRWIPSRNRD